MSLFAITGPALISFSGGRTSAYMLWLILQAHGGTLPADVYVTFANTGKEREETLRFVFECASRWNVVVHWLERGPDGEMVEVGYNSASRKGEPFQALVESRGYLPNAVARFCTVELKIRVMRDFARSLGWEHWRNVIGLRADEPMRVMRSMERSDSGKEPWRNLMPLAGAEPNDPAGVTVQDVRAFWREQSFDLGLRHYEGNCDLCFLKGRKKLGVIMREQPGAADWWIEQERSRTATFVTEYRYADLAREVSEQPHLAFDMPDDEDFDVDCGVACAES